MCAEDNIYEFILLFQCLNDMWLLHHAATQTHDHVFVFVL